MNPLKTLALSQSARFFNGRKQSLWAIVRQTASLDDSVRCLQTLLPNHRTIDAQVVEGLLDELKHADCLREKLEAYRTVISKGWDRRFSGTSFGAALFCFLLLRLAKPAVVVETGCASGWTSALLLFALHQNNAGHLWSIDIPPKAGERSMDWTLPQELSPGFLVPERLRDRWTLTLGDAREHLMPLLRQQQPVDVFLHDSDHTYQHMMWEYTSVWPHLRPGGLLMSDDIGWNTAFWDFGTAVRMPVVMHRSNPNFGTLPKLAG